MQKSFFLALAALPLVFLACGDDGTSGGGGSGGTASNGPGGGSAPCKSAADCPNTGECGDAICEGGVCGIAPAPLGTPAMTQALEDCKRIECDGAGLSQAVPQDDDIKNDNNSCTADSCSMGMRVHEPLAVGSDCDDGGYCDETGTCVECLGATTCGKATECSTPTCEAGDCGVDFAPDGTPLAVQVTGDCEKTVCDGAGDDAQVNDDLDVFNDSNPCTLDGCDMGEPTHDPQPGISCGVGLTCNAMGQCVGCTLPSDCPGTDDFCKTRTCSGQGVCGFSFTAAGMDLPAADQTTGNCQTLECDGQGLIQPVVTPSDLPIDNNDCTLDQCIGGSPMNPNVPQGDPCAMGGSVCDGMGSCVDCNTPADCTNPPGACVLPSCTMGNCGQQNAMNGTVCVAPSCTGGTEQLADTCQTGVCTDGGSAACAPYVCGPSECTATCTDNNGCLAPNTCDTGLMECTSGPTCTAYCGVIEANCTGVNDQYTSNVTCLESCAPLPDGTAADTGGNTVGCRTYHAGAAGPDPATHCRHAGPGGDGACGTNCEGFCTIALGVCTGANQVYSTLAQCLSECAMFPTPVPYNTMTTSGNSLACRLYHLTAAATDPVGHCPHIPLVSATCN